MVDPTARPITSSNKLHGDMRRGYRSLLRADTVEDWRVLKEAGGAP